MLSSLLILNHRLLPAEQMHLSTLISYLHPLEFNSASGDNRAALF